MRVIKINLDGTGPSKDNTSPFLLRYRHFCWCLYVVSTGAATQTHPGLSRTSVCGSRDGGDSSRFGPFSVQLDHCHQPSVVVQTVPLQGAAHL